MSSRPLEASVEQILRADTRAGAQAILASIDKRRFEKPPSQAGLKAFRGAAILSQNSKDMEERMPFQ